MAKTTKRQIKLNEIDKQKLEVEAHQQILRQKEAEFEAIVAEQEANRASAEADIASLCKERNLFCGVILTEEDIFNLIRVKLANPRENVKIRFSLYIQEEEIDNGTV